MSASSHSTHTLRELATILDETAQAVEVLGASLCSDFALMEKHMGSLQGLDLICQTVRQVGLILCEEGTPDSFEHIHLESLRERLEEADVRRRAAA